MNRMKISCIALALSSTVTVAVAQNLSAASPCPTGMTLTINSLTGTRKCIGTHIRNAPGNLATLPAAIDAARAAASLGIAATAAAQASTPASNTRAQDYSGNQTGSSQATYGFFNTDPRANEGPSRDRNESPSAYNRWTDMPAGTYAQYLAKMAAAKDDPLSSWLNSGSQPLSETAWNAQNARVANDASRGIVFGGGSAPAPATYGFFNTDPRANEGPSRDRNEAPSAYNRWADMPAGTYAQYLAKMAASKNDPLSAWLNSGSQTLSEADWNAQNARVANDASRGIVFGGGSAPASAPATYGFFNTDPRANEGPNRDRIETAASSPKAPIGSFCSPWGNTVTWDSTGAHTDTGQPCK